MEESAGMLIVKAGLATLLFGCVAFGVTWLASEADLALEQRPSQVTKWRIVKCMSETNKRGATLKNDRLRGW